MSPDMEIIIYKLTTANNCKNNDGIFLSLSRLLTTVVRIRSLRNRLCR